MNLTMPSFNRKIHGISPSPSLPEEFLKHLGVDSIHPIRNSLESSWNSCEPCVIGDQWQTVQSFLLQLIYIICMYIFLIYTSYIDYTTLTEYLSAFLPSILPLILSKLPPMVQCSDRSHAGILDLKAACLGIKEGKTWRHKNLRKFSWCFYGNLKEMRWWCDHLCLCYVPHYKKIMVGCQGCQAATAPR